MMKAEFGIDDAMKAIAWEEAKGKLRALVAIQGSYRSTEQDNRYDKFKKLEDEVNNFIKRIEYNGLEE